MLKPHCNTIQRHVSTPSLLRHNLPFPELVYFHFICKHFLVFDINEMKSYLSCIYVFMVIVLIFCVYVYVWISGIRVVSSLTVFLWMSPTRLGYKEWKLKPIKPLNDQPHKSWKPPMTEEKKAEGVGYPFKILIKEALERQRNVMIDKFSQC